MRGLHGGDRTVFGPGYFDQLLRGALLAGADVKVITNEKQKRFVLCKFTRAQYGVSVTARGGLLDEMETIAVTASRSSVRRLVARRHHDANLLDPGGANFLDQDRQRGFLNAIAVYQSLQGESALGFARGGDDRLFDFHSVLLYCAERQKRCRMKQARQLRRGAAK